MYRREKTLQRCELCLGNDRLQAGVFSLGRIHEVDETGPPSPIQGSRVDGKSSLGDHQSSLGKSPRSGRNMLSFAHANTYTDDVAVDLRRSFRLRARLA
jgi:hypothetical protein